MNIKSIHLKNDVGSYDDYINLFTHYKHVEYKLRSKLEPRRIKVFHVSNCQKSQNAFIKFKGRCV